MNRWPMATRRLPLRWLPALAAIALIVTVTFPWVLEDHSHWRRVAWIPFFTGEVRLRDLVLNVLLYVPLGWFTPGATRRSRIWTTLAVALVVSGAMEMAQVWSHSRFPSMTDTAMNLIGAVTGSLWASRRR